MSKKTIPFPRSRKPQKKPDRMTYLLDQATAPGSIVAEINILLRMLEKQGIRITDFDYPDRALHRIQMVRGKYRYLAGNPDGDDTH